MKIREVIIEAPSNGVTIGKAVSGASKGIGTVAGGVAAAPDRLVKGYKKGHAAIDKLLSPSKWFGGKDDQTKLDPADIPKVEPVAGAAPEKSTALNSDSVVQILDLVTRGSPLVASDIALLKTLRSNVRNKMYDTDNPDAVDQALRTVINGQPLNSKQISTLQQFSRLF